MSFYKGTFIFQPVEQWLQKNWLRWFSSDTVRSKTLQKRSTCSLQKHGDVSMMWTKGVFDDVIVCTSFLSCFLSIFSDIVVIDVYCNKCKQRKNNLLLIWFFSKVFLTKNNPVQRGLINWKIYVNPSQIRTELPSMSSVDNLGLL